MSGNLVANPNRNHRTCGYGKDCKQIKVDLVIKNNRTWNLLVDGVSVNRESLVAKKLVDKSAPLIKVLGDGDITKKLTVDVDKVSASAKEKLVKAGGSVKDAETDSEAK